MAEPDNKRTKASEEEAKLEEDEEQAAQEMSKALGEIESLQEELERITDEASDRVLAIEQEYTKKRRPVYKQRSELLKQVPRFWVHALAKHPTINAMLTDDDIEVLNYCTEVDVEDFEDIKSGFQITMNFESNPFFVNASLSKTFHYAEDGSLTIKSTEIEWKEGMGPEYEQVGSKRGSRKDYRFMLWFLDEELEAGQHDELADLIKDDLWTNPVRYFAGQVEEGEEVEYAEGEELDEGAAGYDEVFEEEGDEGGEYAGLDEGGDEDGEGAGEGEEGS